MDVKSYRFGNVGFMVFAVFTALLALSAIEARAADVSENKWDVTLTVGAGHVEADVRDPEHEVTDETTLGYKVAAARRVTPAWQVELSFVEFGSVLVEEVNEIAKGHRAEYWAAGASVGRWLLDPSNRVNALVKVGYASLRSSADAHAGVRLLKDPHVTVGGAVQLKLQNDYHFKVELERYHSDLAWFGFGFGKTF